MTPFQIELAKLLRYKALPQHFKEEVLDVTSDYYVPEVDLSSAMIVQILNDYFKVLWFMHDSRLTPDIEKWTQRALAFKQVIYIIYIHTERK